MADDRIDYQALAEFRYQIRRFLHFSEQAARAAGIEPQQHQLLLAIKGLPESLRPTIGTLADRMQLQHHSAVELIDRLRREVLIELSAKGERLLRELSLYHQQELRDSGPALSQSLRRLTARTPSSVSAEKMIGASRRPVSRRK